MKTKVFISQPMNGKTNEEIKAEREILIAKAKENYGDIEVIDSFFNDGKKHPPLESLGKSICLMGQADVVFFSKDWESARGCKIENQCAIAYGIETVECYSY